MFRASTGKELVARSRKDSVVSTKAFIASENARLEELTRAGARDMFHSSSRIYSQMLDGGQSSASKMVGANVGITAASAGSRER
eukprot:1483928-Pleurochrysis_carterae.AAC.1